MTPEHFLARRFAALAAGDYRAVYAGYHPQSPLCQQFPDASAYLQFARQQLQGIKVVSWQCLRQRSITLGEVECLLVLRIDVAGETTTLFELARLIQGPEGWQYHSAQKLTAEDFTGPQDRIDFHHFDRARTRIRF